MTGRQLRKARRAAERLDRKSVPSQIQNRPEINRLNAAHSTGPRTPEGKSRSSQNSFKHVLYSKQLVLPCEDPAELDELRTSLRAEHLPVTLTEEILVNELAENFWRLRRFRCLETRFFSAEHFDAPFLAAIQRSLAASERAFHKALVTLRQLQKERGFVPQKTQESQPESASAAQRGFVSQNCSDRQDDPAFLSEAKTQRAFVSQNPCIEVEFQPSDTPQTCSKAA